jgi:hypothetical protein
MFLRDSFKKKIFLNKYLFASLKSLKKKVGSRVGSGSRSVGQRYGSPEPDQHQNVREIIL